MEFGSGSALLIVFICRLLDLKEFDWSERVWTKWNLDLTFAKEAAATGLSSHLANGTEELSPIALRTLWYSRPSRCPNMRIPSLYLDVLKILQQANSATSQDFRGSKRGSVKSAGFEPKASPCPCLSKNLTILVGTERKIEPAPYSTYITPP